MANPVTTRVRIQHRTNEAVSNEAVLEVAHLAPPERLFRAFIGLIVCWLVAGLCILVPVLHFFLVPMGALAGIGVFFYKIRQMELRSATKIDCPKCGSKITLKKAAFNWPMRDTCNACRTELTIEPVN